MPDFSPPLASEAELRLHIVKFVGGTAAVTKVWGHGVTVTYVSTGVVDIKWSTNDGAPRAFVGLAGAPAFSATVQSGVKGYTCVTDYTSATRTLRLNITNASDALADLAASQWLTLTVMFATAVPA